MQTAPQCSFYLHFLISRLPGWGSPLEKVRFFSKRNMTAGSSLQKGPTTSHSCSGEATLSEAHLFKWNISIAGKKAYPDAENVGDSHDSIQQKPGEPCGPTKWTFLCIAWCFSEQGFPIGAFPSEMLLSWWCFIHQQPQHENPPHIFSDQSRLQGTWGQKTFLQDAVKWSRRSSRP